MEIIDTWSKVAVSNCYKKYDILIYIAWNVLATSSTLYFGI